MAWTQTGNLKGPSTAHTFYVDEYGAVGNGTTDDAPKIQAALDACYTAGGGTVVFAPNKTYAVLTFIVVKANTTIMAYGARIKSIHTTTGCFRNFYGDDSFAGYGGHSNISVYGGTWDGNGYDPVSGTGIANGSTNIMTFIKCKNVTVRDAAFLDVAGAHAIEVNAVDGVLIDNCTFNGFIDNSVDQSRRTSEAIEIDLAKAGDSAILLDDNTPCKNVTISNCRIGAASARLGSFGRGIGSHGISQGSWYDNISILNCTIDGTFAEGIRAQMWRNSRIIGNHVSNTGAEGIYAWTNFPTDSYDQAASGLTISDNVVDTTLSSDCIRVYGKEDIVGGRWTDVLISDNICLNAYAYGVNVSWCYGLIVSGNRVRDVGGGMLIFDCYRGSVTGNSIQNSNTNAIGVTGSWSMQVSNNSIDATNTNYGIFVGEATGNTGGMNNIQNNNIRHSKGPAIRVTCPETMIMGNLVRRDDTAHTGSAPVVMTYMPVSTGAVSIAGSAGNACTVAGNDFYQPDALGVGEQFTEANFLVMASPVTSVFRSWDGVILGLGANRISQNSSQNTGMPIPFFIAGTLAAGTILPEFIVPQPMTLTLMQSRCASGASATVRPVINGTVGGTTSAATGTTVVSTTQSVTLAAGDRLGLNVVAAGTGANISVTFWAAY